MWFFRSPQIVFGEDALAHLDQVSGKRAYIVTDGVMKELGFLKIVQDHLEASEIENAYFAEVEPDPSLQTAQRCAASMSEYQPDLVIGLGGGSSLDAAKAAWFLYERPDIELAAVSPFEHFGLGSKAKFITIPTTAGSGAEVSGGAVIKDTQAMRKMEVASYEFVPDLAIVDPRFSDTMPPQLTADSGIDVLTHAVEGYSSTFTNDFSDALCLHAAWMVFTYLPRAYDNGSADAEAREKMANAAAIGGLGMANSHIALGHAMGHSAGIIFNIPHGRITGLCLPYSIEFTANSGVGRYTGLARILDLPAGDELTAAAHLAQAVRVLLRQIDQPVTLQEAGISRAEFEANLDAVCDRVEVDTALATCRRFPYRDELIQLFEYAYDGREVDF